MSLFFQGPCMLRCSPMWVDYAKLSLLIVILPSFWGFLYPSARYSTPLSLRELGRPLVSLNNLHACSIRCQMPVNSSLEVLNYPTGVWCLFCSLWVLYVLSASLIGDFWAIESPMWIVHLTWLKHVEVPSPMSPRGVFSSTVAFVAWSIWYCTSSFGVITTFYSLLRTLNSSPSRACLSTSLSSRLFTLLTSPDTFCAISSPWAVLVDPMGCGPVLTLLVVASPFCWEELIVCYDELLALAMSFYSLTSSVVCYWGYGWKV